jgi:hypothetical protein
MLNNTVIIVLGMHRSGTSALAGMLSMLGIQFGEGLMPPDTDNPRGFWEHREIVDCNDRILSALGSSWDDMRPPARSWWVDERVAPFRAEIIQILSRDFATARVWGLKDPRICRLVPLWCDILDQLGCRTLCILIHRHPLEVAYSLRERNGFDIKKSGLLWLEHNLLSERSTRGRMRIFTSYEQILNQPEAISLKVSEMVSQAAGAPTERQFDAVRDFISAGLRHHRSVPEVWGEEFGQFRSLIEQAYQELSARCRNDALGEDQAIDRLFDDFQSVTSKFDPILTAHIDDLGFRTGQLREEFARLTSSMSWKVTRPLRAAKKLTAGISKSAIRK